MREEKQKIFAGDKLREMREQLGYTEADIYRKLHIPENFLAALEAGDFDKLPGPTYTLGFLKTYCRFLGIDPEEYIDYLRESTKPSTRFLRFKKRVEPSGPSLVNDILTWAAICAIIALAWITYTIVVQPETEQTDSSVKAGTVEMVVPSASAEE